MFGIGGFELFIILLFGFLIFGPEKLPEIAKTVGRGIARFRQAQDEMNSVIKSTDIYDPNSDEPFKDPMEALDKLAKHQEEKKKAQSKAESAKPASAKNADDAPASGDDAKESPRQESFTERKARYERERAARKAAEQKAAEEAAAAEEAGAAEKAAVAEEVETGAQVEAAPSAQPSTPEPQAASAASDEGGEL